MFQKELEPLIVEHPWRDRARGKRPQRTPGNTDRQTELIRLRREMKEAIGGEKYERASQLRDEIRQIEG